MTDINNSFFGKLSLGKEFQEEYGPQIRTLALNGKNSTEILTELGIIGKYEKSLRYLQGAIGFAIRGCNDYSGLLLPEEVEARKKKVSTNSHINDLEAHLANISQKGVYARGKVPWLNNEKEKLKELLNLPVSNNCNGSYNATFLASSLNYLFHSAEGIRTSKSISVKLKRLGCLDLNKISLENSMFNN